MDALAEIKRMHAAYVAGTGMQIALDMNRELAWGRAYQLGIRTDDIVLVIEWMKQRAKKQMAVRSFAFRNFVGNVDFLEEDIAAAKSEARIRRPHAIAHQCCRPLAARPPPSRRRPAAPGKSWHPAHSFRSWRNSKKRRVCDSLQAL